MRRLNQYGRLICSWAVALFVATFVVMPSGMADDEEMGPEPEWNCPNVYEFCATMIGCPAGAFYIGAEALTKARGTGYTVEPADDDEWYPMEWIVKHPHGTLSPASGFPSPCSIDQTNRNESELKLPDYHCAAFYQEQDRLTVLLVSVNVTAPCMGWLECICY